VSTILVVGSLAYDGIQTPHGRVERALGGSANYFSIAASHFAKVRVVGVVGDDYQASDEKLLLERGVDLTGLEKVKGKTFFWQGRYEDDMNQAITLKTDLNVFENFNPKLPIDYKNSKFVFLANIAPLLQLQILEQVDAPTFVGMDTMNFWIASQKENLLQVIKKVDVILINEGEAKMLTGKANAIAAASEIVKMGPQAVVIKRGEYGFALYHKSHGFSILPAMPMAKVVDPTGAGDTFAGGFFGHLANLDRKPTFSDLKQACINGTLLASFTIEDFSVNSLAKVTAADISTRRQQYVQVVNYN
jgi:sugar/nucleoside kinase (ribokinase family)